LNKSNVVRLVNGIVLPLKDGVLDENGQYVNLSAYRNKPPRIYENWQKDLLVYNKKIIYIGYFHPNHWGHLIIDGLSRLWYLTNDLEDYYFCLVNKYEDNSILKDNYLRLFMLLGIPMLYI
jgi:hypothetical protein